ncbi:GFA family protein [Rhizobium sp. SSA_523]|uniref:GFA family protein n=1 Tax=Rhizobium sp. SSA_523 TaxID=2952477 RepID=UPI002091CECE|nr:GFA family protein [Rhizobium sp. SSA_523]MCO5730005.1 GFA family protein [Rhizobium sp. SSA_523]WKC25078.1 GFA family protein [Rhizobium sp. SSA_523]
MEETVRHGHCLCGTVRLTMKGPFGPVIACHCSQCRRQTGLYLTSTDVERRHLSIAGEDAIAWYRASDKASRGFCSRCGSLLFWAADGASKISVMAGLFDQPSGLQIDHHIYCRDKGDFYEITDGRPQYDTYPAPAPDA